MGMYVAMFCPEGIYQSNKVSQIEQTIVFLIVMYINSGYPLVHWVCTNHTTFCVPIACTWCPIHNIQSSSSAATLIKILDGTAVMTFFCTVENSLVSSGSVSMRGVNEKRLTISSEWRGEPVLSVTYDIVDVVNNFETL